MTVNCILGSGAGSELGLKMELGAWDAAKIICQAHMEPWVPFLHWG
jgi:hypothetical protein